MGLLLLSFALLVLAFEHFCNDDVRQATETGAHLTDAEKLLLRPYVGPKRSYADYSRAKVILLMEVSRPTYDPVDENTWLTDTGEVDPWFLERWADLADVLRQGVEAGVVVMLNVSPYAMRTNEGDPNAGTAANRLYRYSVNLGNQGQPHPGHVACFNVWQQLQDPLYVLCAGTRYWRGMSFFQTAVQQGRVVQRHPHKELQNQGWRLNTNFFDQNDLNRIRDAVTAALNANHG